MVDTELKQIITVDTGEAITNLKDYKKHMDELRGSMLGLEKGTAEYAAVANEVKKEQDKLNEVMTDSKYGVDANVKSYNALQAQMSQLKKEWKQMEFGSKEWKETAVRINELNDKLKDADAQTGNFQRNVGNYSSSFLDAFNKMGEGAKSLNSPLKIAGQGVKAFGASLKTLALNPIGAVIMAVVVAVKALKKGFEGSEEASNKLKQAFSAFQPIINAVSNAFTSFASVVGDIAAKTIPALVNGVVNAEGKILKFLNRVGIVSDEKLKQFQESVEAQKEAGEVTQELTEREIALTKRKRAEQVKQAKLELEISELRAKAADKDKYSAEDREKYLTAAIGKERELNRSKLEIAQEEFDIMNERAKLTDNDAATNDALAAAEANLYNVKREYYEKERRLVAQLNQAKKEDAKESKEDTKDAEKDAKDLYEARKTSIQNQIALIESYLSVVEKGSDEEVRLLKEKEEQNYQLSVEEAKFKIKNEEDLEATIENLKEAHNNRLNKIDEDALKKRLDSAQKVMDNAATESGMLYGANSMEAYDARIAAYQNYYDNLFQLQGESNEDFRTRQLAAEDKLNKEIAAKLQQRITNYTSLATGIGSIMGTIASMYEEDINKRLERGEISEEEAEREFENAKKMQIAETTINMLAGITAAVSGLFTTKSGPWDIALAAVQASSIAAAGLANIQKIKNTQFNGSASSTASVQATPRASDYSPAYFNQVTGLSQQDNINNGLASSMANTQIWVSVSDINEVQNKVKVREEASRF